MGIPELQTNCLITSRGGYGKYLERSNQPFSTTKEIGKEAGLSRYTVAKYILPLLRQGKIKQTRRIANARLYAPA